MKKFYLIIVFSLLIYNCTQSNVVIPSPNESKSPSPFISQTIKPTPSATQTPTVKPSPSIIIQTPKPTSTPEPIITPTPKISPTPNTLAYSDNYDWSKMEIVKNLGKFKVQSIPKINEDFYEIVFSEEAGNLTDPVPYDREFDNFNYDSIYRVKDLNGKYYFFRFGWQEFKNNKTKFSFIRWNEDKSPSPGNLEFELIKVPKIQTGKIEISTVGDSLTWYFYGQKYRQELLKNYPELKFIGSRTDIFGFGHEGEGGNTTEDVLARMEYILPSDNYILLIGTNDIKLTSDQTFQNIVTIVDNLLLKRENAKVFLLTILPVKNQVDRDIRNSEVNKSLSIHYILNPKKNVFLIDTELEFRKLKNLDLLFTDLTHLNNEGYRILSSFVAKNLKSTL